MVKLTICLKRKQGMSHEDFARHWRNVHGPLVLGVADFMRHVRKYVQSDILNDSIPQMPASGFDGVVELWFDTPEAMGAALQEPSYHQLIRPDEEKFIDHSGVVLFVLREVAIHG